MIVLRSTVCMVSIQGRIKKRPGPLAPPGNIRPSLRMTARSYSLTIFKLKKMAIGRVSKKRK